MNSVAPDVFRDWWLLENLSSMPLQIGVMSVWVALPQEDRETLRALKLIVVEREMRTVSGLHAIREVGGRQRRVIALDPRIPSFDRAAGVFAHECAHAVLRHLDYVVGDYGFEQARNFVERQAEALADRWGFSLPDGAEDDGIKKDRD